MLDNAFSFNDDKNTTSKISKHESGMSSTETLAEHVKAVKHAALNLYGHAFAADKDVIRADFQQRRRIMRQHYNLNSKCRPFIRITLCLLSLFFTAFLIFEMDLAKSSVIDDVNSNLVSSSSFNDNNDKCPYNYNDIKYNNVNMNIFSVDVDDNELLDSSLINSLFSNSTSIEWYWLIFTIISILMYNILVFIIYYGFFSFFLIIRQTCFKKCKFDLCSIPFALCYYTNRWRLYHIATSSKFENKIHIDAISSDVNGINTPITNNNKTNSIFCLCCVKPNRLLLTLETVESKSSPQQDNLSSSNNPLISIKQEDDYGNADICYTIFCCYCRCFNFCHYGLFQGPNAPRLLTFFDPIKNQDEDNI